ncbi:MAG: TRAP transporter small permease [Dethiobacteria bacterium]|jgi:TRAP-type C4-dicarboxylate transport system permease small subunit
MKESSNILQTNSPESVLVGGGAPLGAFRGFDKANFVVGFWFENIAIIAIVGIIVSNLIDVVGAKLFGKPIAAGTEIVYFLQVIAMSAALTSTKIDGKHIRIEFIDNLPARLANVFHFIVAILGLALFIILCWKSVEYAQSLKAIQEVTAVSRIAIYPFALWVAVCCVPLCMVLFKELLESVIRVVRG